MSKEDAIEVELFSGRERKREPAAEILSGARDLLKKSIKGANE